MKVFFSEAFEKCAGVSVRLVLDLIGPMVDVEIANPKVVFILKVD